MSTNGNGPLPGGEGARRHHRRRQLRLLLRPGRPVLQGRRSRRAGARPHARRPRRLPRPRHRVLGRVRHRRREGRQGPLRGDLRRPEQHAELRRRGPAPGRRGHARHDARRPRQVPHAEDHEGAGLDGRHRPGAQGHAHRRRRLLPAGRLRAGDEVVRRADPRGRLRLRELHPGLHRPRGLLEQPLPQGRACRSSATTSSRRSARRSCTARSRACSTSAASSCCARRSSTSAATWTSSTCSSASGWSPRRSPRPTRSRR